MSKEGVMTSPNEPTGYRPLTAFEVVGIMVALAGAFGAQLVLTKSMYLFRRNFWIDELYTHAIVADPDLSHSLRVVASGLESNPPGYHLLLRAYTRLIGNG